MSEVDELRAALKWCMPLVDQALEDCRQMRLRAGHSDIGAGTKHIGLWPFEVTARDNARALANGGEPEPKPDPLRNNPIVGFMSEKQAEGILEEIRDEKRRGVW